jgi:hypothetical protein
MADDQEAYLNNTSLGKICVRGVKKLVTEISSIKTLAMGAIVGLVYFGKMDSMAGVIGLLGLVGAKEIDFTQVIEIVKSKFGK